MSVSMTPKQTLQYILRKSHRKLESDVPIQTLPVSNGKKFLIAASTYHFLCRKYGIESHALNSVASIVEIFVNSFYDSLALAADLDDKNIPKFLLAKVGYIDTPKYDLMTKVIPFVYKELRRTNKSYSQVARGQDSYLQCYREIFRLVSHRKVGKKLLV